MDWGTVAAWAAVATAWLGQLLAVGIWLANRHQTMWKRIDGVGQMATDTASKVQDVTRRLERGEGKFDEIASALSEIRQSQARVEEHLRHLSTEH